MILGVSSSLFNNFNQHLKDCIDNTFAFEDPVLRHTKLYLAH